MSSIFNQIRNSIANWRVRRSSIHALSVLSDHMLKDIGLHRSEITSFAAELTSQAEPSRARTAQSTSPAKQNARARAISAPADEWQKAA